MKCRYQLTVNFPVHPAFVGEPLLENEAQNEAQNSSLSERQMTIIAAIKTDDKITRTKQNKVIVDSSLPDTNIDDFIANLS